MRRLGWETPAPRRPSRHRTIWLFAAMALLSALWHWLVCHQGVRPVIQPPLLVGVLIIAGFFGIHVPVRRAIEDHQTLILALLLLGLGLLASLPTFFSGLQSNPIFSWSPKLFLGAWHVPVLSPFLWGFIVGGCVLASRRFLHGFAGLITGSLLAAGSALVLQHAMTGTSQFWRWGSDMPASIVAASWFIAACAGWFIVNRQLRDDQVDDSTPAWLVAVFVGHMAALSHLTSTAKVSL